MNPTRPLLAAALAALAAAGCSSVVCGPGTQQSYNQATGETTCVPALAQKGVQCDPATAKIEGGICKADPTKSPTCGAGTMLDKPSNSCVPTGMGVIQPKPCNATQGDKKFCVNGIVRYLKDDSYTKGKTFEVRAYDPLAFLQNPTGTKPLVTATTDENGTYVMNDIPVNGTGLVAIAVVDMPQTDYILSGAGARNVSAGGKYQVDLYAIEKALVASWDMQAGLSGGETFEMRGGYLARFYDKAEKPVAGVVLLRDGAPAADQFFFKGSMTTIDKAQTATDAATGSVIHKFNPGLLPAFSGMGGGQSWEEVPGASVGGVIFVQRLHPAT